MINNKMYKKNTSSLSLTLPLLSFNATAETDIGAYICAGFGEVDIDTDGFEFIGGYQFNNNLAIEASYVDFGEASDNEEPDRAITADSLTVAVVGKIPLHDNFDILQKLAITLGM